MKTNYQNQYRNLTIMGINFKQLVKSILHHYHIPAASCLDENDMLQEAYLAILEAQLRFNPDHGTPFEAFAATYIHKYANDAIHRYRSRLSYTASRPFTEDDKPTLSMDTVVTQDEDGSDPILLSDTLASDTPTPEQILIWLQDKHLLQQALTQLTPREQLILTYLYGLNGHEPIAAEALATTMAVSKWSIHKVRERALKKLHKSKIILSNFVP